MVDSTKRNSLKSLGGLMAMPLVPTSLIPSISKATERSAATALSNLHGLEGLSISLELSGKPVMRVTNNSDSL